MNQMENLKFYQRQEISTSLTIMNCYFHCHSHTVGGALYGLVENTGAVTLNDNVFYHCVSTADFAAFSLVFPNFMQSRTCFYRSEAHSSVLLACGRIQNDNDEVVISGSTGKGVSGWFDQGFLKINNYNSTHNVLTAVAGALLFSGAYSTLMRYTVLDYNYGGSEIVRNGGGGAERINEHVNLIYNEVGNDPSSAIFRAQSGPTTIKNCILRGNKIPGQAALLTRFGSNLDAECGNFFDCVFDFASAVVPYATFTDCEFGKITNRQISVFATDICVIPTQWLIRRSRMFAPILLPFIAYD